MRLAIIVVVDSKSLDISQFVGLRAQNACKDRVESAHPDVAGVVADKFHDTILHFGGSLVGEGESQNIERVDALLNEMGDTISESASLAAASASDNHHRALGTRGCFALSVIKLRKKR